MSSDKLKKVARELLDSARAAEASKKAAKTPQARKVFAFREELYRATAARLLMEA